MAMLGLLYRYFFLQVVQNEEYRAQSDRNRIAVRTVAPTRGVIVDRSGNLLAVNTPSFTLAITPERADDLDAVVAAAEGPHGLLHCVFGCPFIDRARFGPLVMLIIAMPCALANPVMPSIAMPCMFFSAIYYDLASI